jgi:hypothetical protein
MSSSGGSPCDRPPPAPPCPDASPLVASKPSSRWPAEPCTFMPAYCQVVTSYSPLSGSQPEKSPSSSSVSWNSSFTITGAFV